MFKAKILSKPLGKTKYHLATFDHKLSQGVNLQQSILEEVVSGNIHSRKTWYFNIHLINNIISNVLFFFSHMMRYRDCNKKLLRPCCQGSNSSTWSPTSRRNCRGWSTSSRRASIMTRMKWHSRGSKDIKMRPIKRHLLTQLRDAVRTMLSWSTIRVTGPSRSCQLRSTSNSRKVNLSSGYST